MRRVSRPSRGSSRSSNVPATVASFSELVCRRARPLMPPGFLARPKANAVRLGTELPPGIGLRPVPDDLAARVPQTKDYSYAVTHDRVLLVGTSRVVAGGFADANVPVSQGRRGP